MAKKGKRNETERSVPKNKARLTFAGFSVRPRWKAEISDRLFAKLIVEWQKSRAFFESMLNYTGNRFHQRDQKTGNGPDRDFWTSKHAGRGT